MTLLTTAVVLLAIVIALHLLLTFGLVARLRQLQESGLPQRDLDLPQPGRVIGKFALSDVDGRPVTHDDLVGPVWVGFFSVGCAPCTTLSDTLAAASPAAPFIAIVDGEPETGPTRRLVAKLAAFARVALVESDDPVITTFGVPGYPTLVSTHSGVVTASGSRLSHFDKTATKALTG